MVCRLKKTLYVVYTVQRNDDVIQSVKQFAEAKSEIFYQKKIKLSKTWTKSIEVHGIYVENGCNNCTSFIV